MFDIARKGSSICLKIDWGKVKNISAPGYAILACLSDTFIEHCCQVEHVNTHHISLSNPTVANLIKEIRPEREGHWNFHPSNIYNFENATMILSGQYDAINMGFVKKLREKFHKKLPTSVISYSILIINELMQNSVDHSGAERYYLYAGITSLDYHVAQFPNILAINHTF